MKEPSSLNFQTDSISVSQLSEKLKSVDNVTCEKSEESAKPDVAHASPQAKTTHSKVNGEKIVTDSNLQVQKPYNKKTHKDFIWGKVIGEGSSATVYLAKDINTNKNYAIKVCEKELILKEKKQKYISREKEVLDILNHNAKKEVPFFVKLYFTFQDSSRLYFALSYLPRGELYQYININKAGSGFDAETAKFYSGEILLALEHLHSLGIVHRDLKPENIILTEDFHICITDFGSAKFMNHTKEIAEGSTDDKSDAPRRSSFVGTPQYVSPEVLQGKVATCSSDLWALGCIIYQMVCGVPPFQGMHEYGIYQKIVKASYDFTENFDAKSKSLVESLLVLDPKSRLGAGDTDKYCSLRSHDYFKDMDFDSLYLQRSPLVKLIDHSEFQSTEFKVPDDAQPGLDDKQMNRLLELGLHDSNSHLAKSLDSTVPFPTSVNRKPGLLDFTHEQQLENLKLQAQNNPYHEFVEGNLILKQGLMDKRKGLFARRRMFLLTTGPRLFYVDPVHQVLKGEVPWSKNFFAELKTFKTFHIHTTNRTYYIEDPSYHAADWCKALNEVWQQSYGKE